jgi:hypothetical protein
MLEFKEKGTIMDSTLILIVLEVCTLAGLGLSLGLLVSQNSKIRAIAQNLSHQYAILVKMQAVLKSKYATNAVAENAEMIYQDLLQNLIPIMAALDIMPRQSAEHPLWRAIGGIMDSYSQNPFVLENLRRTIKNNPDAARALDNYMNRAEKFLNHLNATDPDGILAATFTDGLLGGSLTFFAQAKQLANAE